MTTSPFSEELKKINGGIDLTRLLGPIQQPKDFEFDPETKIIKGAEPFHMGPDDEANLPSSASENKNKQGLLLLHGWTSSPREMRPLAQALKQEFHCYGPRLRGHGKTWQDLADTYWSQHLSDCTQAYTELKEDCKEVNVVGLSYGAILALHLAARRKIKKLVLLSPFYEDASSFLHLTKKSKLLPFLPKKIKLLPKAQGGPIFEPEENKKHIAYPCMPIEALRSLLQSRKQVKELLPAIQCPVLIIHSPLDKTAAFDGSVKLLKQIGSEQKSLVCLSRSNHILTLDYEKDYVVEQVKNFLNA